MDFRVAKTRKFNSVKKSNTAVALPGIQKTIAYPEHQHKKNKSSYLETISHLSSNAEYDHKDTLYVNKEQSALKTILKKMNKDTMDLIENLRPRKIHKPVNRELLNQTAEKEVENSKKMIAILRHQIDNLKDKYSRMADHHEEQEVLRKIVETKQEIDRIKQTNVEQKLTVDKDSKQILRQFTEAHDQKLLMLETDYQMVTLKLQKLKGESQRVQEQQEKLCAKAKEADQTIQLIESDYTRAKEWKTEQADSKKRESLYSEKKLHLQSIKKKIEFHNSFGQVRYYKALKELEAENAVVQMIDGKTGQIEAKNKYVRDEVGKLQSEFREMKRRKREKGKAVQDYLQSERMSRVIQNSRFLQDLNASAIEVKPQTSKTDSEISKEQDRLQKVEEIRIENQDIQDKDPSSSEKPGESAPEVNSAVENESLGAQLGP